MLKQVRIVLLVAALILLLPLASYGEIYRVDASSPATTPNGSTWQLAYQLLQDAMDRSTTGDTIWVAGGTYRPDLDTTDLFTPEHAQDVRTESFSLKAGVILLGGFSGNANLSAPDVRGLAVSVLSGDIGTASDSTDNSFHVVTGGTSTSSTLLDGFTIKFGNGNGTTDSTKRGAGIYLLGDIAPSIENCIIEYCTVDDETGIGGGIFIGEAATARLLGLTLRHNVAGTGGGIGITGSGDAINVINCFFSFNTGYSGGGLYTERSTTVFQSDFGQNSITAILGQFNGGAAIAAVGTTIEVRECNIGHNTADATAASVQGGGLYVDGGNGLVVRCNFIENKIISDASDIYNAQGGGAYLHPGGQVLNCVFQGNKIETSSEDGSGIAGALVVNKEAEVINSLFFDNAANDAGAIWISNTPVNITNCTIARNVASGTGGPHSGSAGGIFLDPIDSTPPTGAEITNCILWDNTGGFEDVEEQQVYIGFYGAVITVRYCDIEDPVL